MKLCKRCKTEKSEENFSPYLRSKDGLFSWCKKCNCELEKGRYSKLTPEERKLKNRHHRSEKAQEKAHTKQSERYRSDPEYRLRIGTVANAKRYGITPEEYLERRSRPCAICGVYKLEPRKPGSGMHVDHNKTTGQLRGTLCARCNRGIGMFDESPEKLLGAVSYLKSFDPVV